ncbi:MAG: hypothetical protein VCE91_13735 [Nitrospinota bacterium]
MSAHGIQSSSGVQALAAAGGSLRNASGSQNAALQIVLSAVQVVQGAAALVAGGRGGSLNIQA